VSFWDRTGLEPSAVRKAGEFLVEWSNACNIELYQNGGLDDPGGGGPAQAASAIIWGVGALLIGADELMQGVARATVNRFVGGTGGPTLSFGGALAPPRGASPGDSRPLCDCIAPDPRIRGPVRGSAGGLSAGLAGPSGGGGGGGPGGASGCSGSSSCGLGPELALLLLAVRRTRWHRRSAGTRRFI
jgi:hypothetical protein